MAKNKSHAVMAQRHEDTGSFDYFPTPPWAVRALITQILAPLDIAVPAETVWEPAAGEGYLVGPLIEYFGAAHASDVLDYGVGYPTFDFLSLRDTLLESSPPFGTVDWIITNPPFNRFTDFATIAAAHARVGVAMFGRTQALEGIDRYKRIYLAWYERVMWCQFVERVPIVKGRVDPEASTATAYGWLVITKQRNWPHPYVNRWPPGRAPQLILIPPCRKALERREDYRRIAA